MYESLSSVPSSLKRGDERGAWEGGREREERKERVRVLLLQAKGGSLDVFSTLLVNV